MKRTLRAFAPLRGLPDFPISEDKTSDSSCDDNCEWSGDLTAASCWSALGAAMEQGWINLGKPFTAGAESDDELCVEEYLHYSEYARSRFFPDFNKISHSCDSLTIVCAARSTAAYASSSRAASYSSRPRPAISPPAGPSSTARMAGGDAGPNSTPTCSATSAPPPSSDSTAPSASRPPPRCPGPGRGSERVGGSDGRGAGRRRKRRQGPTWPRDRGLWDRDESRADNRGGPAAGMKRGRVTQRDRLTQRDKVTACSRELR